MRRKRATEKKDREITFESKWVRQGIKRWTKKKNSFQQSSSHFFMLMNSWVSGSSLEEIERRLCRTSLLHPLDPLSHWFILIIFLLFFLLPRHLVLLPQSHSLPFSDVTWLPIQESCHITMISVSLLYVRENCMRTIVWDRAMNISMKTSLPLSSLCKYYFLFCHTINKMCKQRTPWKFIPDHF